MNPLESARKQIEIKEVDIYYKYFALPDSPG